MARLFIAFELPATVLDAIEARVADLGRIGADVRWSARDHLHATLEFLGEVPETGIPGVEEMLKRVCLESGPVALEARGLGSFGGRTPRVVWVGVHGATEADLDTLHRLRRLVHRGAAGLGLASDREDFTAHVTLGRVRGPRGSQALHEAIRAGRDLPFGSFPVEELVLFQSRLSPAGSTYTRLARAPLDRPRAEEP